MVVFDTSLREIKIHKRRNHKFSKNIKINFGEYALVSANESKMELIQFTFLKRTLKKLIKRKKKVKSKGKKSTQGGDAKSKTKNYKIWVNILPNYVLSRKSKNSRMGKGKGSFSRWVFRFQQGVTLVEFLGIPYYRLINAVRKIQKKLNLKLKLIKRINYNDSFSAWSKLNYTILYFNKHRYM